MRYAIRLEHRELRPRLLEGHGPATWQRARHATGILHRRARSRSRGRRASAEPLGLAPRCASCSPILPPTRRRTTTRSRRRSCGRVSTSACSRPASASAPCRPPTGTRSTTASTASRRGSARGTAASPRRRSSTRVALARLALADCDLLHLQWVAAPEADAWLLHTRRPLVFTAHDLLPRRTARHTRTWKRLFGRFDRVVTHSERGRRTLEAFGVPDGEAARHPPPRLPQRSGPGRRRPHGPRARRDPALQGPSRRGRGRRSASRARGSSSPAIPGSRSTRSGGGGRPRRVAARLPERARRSRARSAPPRSPSSPTGPSSTSPGALLQAIGAGVPAVVYDVGGLGEIVGAFGAGRVVPPGDVDGPEARPARAARRRRRARRGARGRRARPRRASPGTARRPSTWRSTRSSREVPPPRPLPRPRRAAARPLRRRRCRAARRGGRGRGRPGTRPPAEDAEEAYGDYQLVVDAIADRLLDIRESYARSLDEDAATEYAAEFTRAATQAVPPLHDAARRPRRAVSGVSPCGVEPGRRATSPGARG